MTTLVSIIVALAAIAFVGYPLLRETDESRPQGADDSAEELKARRQELRDAAAELEADRQAGKLSVEDYQAMRNDISQKEAALSEAAVRPRASADGHGGKRTGNDLKRGKSRSKR